MAVAWFIAQYKAKPGRPSMRYPAIEDHRALILGDGGRYGYREILGNSAVVKVAGVTVATLAAINLDPVIRRFPAVNTLGDNLGVLTALQWGNYRQFALDLGYPAAEWDAAFPLDKSAYALRDVVRFVFKRRLMPRFDEPTQAVILDGASVPGQPADLDGLDIDTADG